MKTRSKPGAGQVGPFLAKLLARAARLRFRDLFARPQPAAVYQRLDRAGVSVVALETAVLTDRQLDALLRWRLAQYLATGLADPFAVHESGLEAEPRSTVSPGDLHLLAGTAREGVLLCSLELRGLPAPSAEPMRSRDRPPFPVEEAHGAGIFDRVPILAGLPAAGVRELGRLVANQQPRGLDELEARAPAELLVALVRVLAGPLRPQVEAIVGEIEGGAAERTLGLVDLPTVRISGAIPCDAGPAYMCSHLNRAVYPFAALVSDLVAHSVPRADAIEQALSLPGEEGVRALLALQATAAPPASALEPPGGLPPLAAEYVHHSHLRPALRRQLRADGESLRQVSPFERLSAAEASVLRRFMTLRAADDGEVLTREGDPGDALFVVLGGEAEVSVADADGGRRVVRRLGPGTSFGEIALALGSARTADVVAVTPMTVLELSGDAYERYLRTIADVDEAFVTTAIERLGGRS